MRLKSVATALAVALAASQVAQAQPRTPTMSVCLWAHSPDARNARYKVVINWNGLTAGQFARFDIGVEDAGNDVWPQLRDNRLWPRAAPTEQMIVISDVSRYPLHFVLLGFERSADERFDGACTDGLCSVRIPSDGIEELTGEDGAGAASVGQARRCVRG